jgi:hypothetical protein
MSEFYLSKYPVVSDSGKEYRVDIYPDHLYARHVICGIFTVVEKRNIFGKERKKFRQLNNTNIGRTIYEEKKFNYDYIAIAREEIKAYEDECREYEEFKQGRNTGIKNFNRWIGRGDGSR